jgi:hypothetical protein
MKRPPRVGLILLCVLLLGGLISGILWKLTGRLWIALPVGLIGGYLGVMVFNAQFGSGDFGPGPRGPDDPRAS